MFDLKTLNVGDKVRVVNNVDNNVERYKFVKIGDIAKILSFGNETPVVELYSDNWKHSLYFEEFQFEPILATSKSEDLIIYKSRWDEIIEKLEGGYGMSDEEVEVVKSVLKNNIPFNVVPDLVDLVISKEVQTHLDATHIGDTRHFNLYYMSKLLNKLFWWNSTSWVESGFNYEDDGDLIPISFGVGIGESK